jgi:hypothetical protein
MTIKQHQREDIPTKALIVPKSFCEAEVIKEILNETKKDNFSFAKAKRLAEKTDILQGPSLKRYAF